MRLPDVFPDPRLMALNVHAYLDGRDGPSHARMVALAAALEVALAVLFAYGLYRLGPRHWRVGVTVQLNALSFTFREGGAGRDAYVRAITTDGVALKGRLAAHDHGGSTDDGWLVLETPVKRGPAASEPESVIDLPWERVVVPLRSIAEMHVAHAPSTPEQTPKRSRRSK